MKLLSLAILLLSFSLTLSANQSPYHGQQNREIKSLSEQDINALVSGSGWGLAKPAELNGVPGPLHLLELRDEIGLTEHQVKEIEGVWLSMNQSAKNHGEKYLISERKIDHFFKANREDLKNLDKLLKESSYHLTNLRLTHLAAHLQVYPLLSREQVIKYNKLRGYSDHQNNHREGHGKH